MQTSTETISGRLISVLLLLLAFYSTGAKATTIIDDEQQHVTFSEPFTRIISLYPAHTENLMALGCENQVLGVGLSDDYPPAVSDKQRFSYRDNIEKFLASNPDLILIRPMISRSQPELIEQLRFAGVTVVSLQPTSIEKMYSYWQQLGELCGSEGNARQLITTFQSDVDKLKKRLPASHADRPVVYFEAIHSKMKTFSPSSISIFTLKSGGGRNVATDAVARNNSNIAPYGKERILSKAESIDVFLSQVGRMNRITADDIYSEPGFQLIKAVQNQAVFLVEEEIVSRPTPRLLLGIQAIQSALYPGINGKDRDLVGVDSPHKPQQTWP